LRPDLSIVIRGSANLNGLDHPSLGPLYQLVLLLNKHKKLCDPWLQLFDLTPGGIPFAP